MDISGDGESSPGMFGGEEFHARPIKTSTYSSVARPARNAGSLAARAGVTIGLRISFDPAPPFGEVVSQIKPTPAEQARRLLSGLTSNVNLVEIELRVGYAAA
ncbi:MAG: hypothetical protein WDZ48_07610 [Pirellulales bacterium]